MVSPEISENLPQIKIPSSSEESWRSFKEKLQVYGKYPDITLFYLFSRLPLTSAFSWGLAKASNITLKGIRAETIVNLFGERGKNWLEETGRGNWLREKLKPSPHTDQDLKEAINILIVPPSSGLSEVESEIRSLLMQPDNIFESNYSLEILKEKLPEDLTEEFFLRWESLITIVTEFVHPARRERPHSDQNRVLVISRIKELTQQGKRKDKMPILELERRTLVRLLTETSPVERAPKVLKEMAEIMGDWLKIWIDRPLREQEHQREALFRGLSEAIRAERITGQRVDIPPLKKREIENFSFKEAEIMAKSLVSLCFRFSPEVKEVALRKIAALIKEMDGWYCQSRIDKVKTVASEDFSQQWELIRKILSSSSTWEVD